MSGLPLVTSCADIPEGAAAPKGPFTIRICAGCGEQINDGHHGHGWQGKGLLTPVYEIAAVPESQLDDLVHVDEATTAQMDAVFFHDALDKIAKRRPSAADAAAAFHRCRRDAREALRAVKGKWR